MLEKWGCQSPHWPPSCPLSPCLSFLPPPRLQPRESCEAWELCVGIFPSPEKEEVVLEAPLSGQGGSGRTLSLGLSLRLLLPQPPDLLQAPGVWADLMPQP